MKFSFKNSNSNVNFMIRQIFSKNQTSLNNRNKKFNFNSFPKKTFFNIFSKIIQKSKTELIIHPELGGEQTNANFTEYDAEDEEGFEDESLNFISLDKNGVPIIKKNYYELLGVKASASSKEIKTNFLKIARKYHPDKNPHTLEFFTQICNAYETLMDVHKRAAYDDDLLNSSEGVFYIHIWKFRINVIFFSLFALLFFMSKYAWDYYRNHLRIKYICPLGEEKFEVDKLKFTEKNISLLNFIETTKEQLLAENTKKIAEDEEYEYYIEEEK